MSSLYSVIQKFIVTNKSTEGELRGMYTCIIDPRSTKIDVKRAIETIYGVKVAKVNMLHTREKFHNTKNGILKKKSPEKKAMITLAAGNKIVNIEVVK
jgi:large subunit ribosomal protein L23